MRLPKDSKALGFPRDGEVIVEYDDEEHALVCTPSDADIGDTEELGEHPQSAEEFASFYEEQLGHAQSDSDKEPASPDEVAQLYEQQLKLARREVVGDSNLRNYYMRRAYSCDAGSMRTLAEIF